MTGNKDSRFVTPEINLLPQDDLEGKPGGKFLKWALSWGKKIVVLTELFVVLAFMSRFKFDSDVASYSEEIDRRRTIILASANFERQFRLTSDRVAKAKAIDVSISPVEVFDKAIRLIPSGVAISEISVTDKIVRFEGRGEDALLTAMVLAFRASSDFDNVVLNRVSKQSKNPQVDFAFTARFVAKR